MNDNFYSFEASVWGYYDHREWNFAPDEVWDSLINLRDEENQ